MSWSDFYLFCFLVGFAFSALTFLAGAVHIHLPFRLHLPGHGGHQGGHGFAAKGPGSRAGSHISWFNASTMMAFLAWFGGAGYILTRASHLVALVCLALAALAGLVAGMIVYRFVPRAAFHASAGADWESAPAFFLGRSPQGEGHGC
jgi:hypothetical protein